MAIEWFKKAAQPAPPASRSASKNSVLLSQLLNEGLVMRLSEAKDKPQAVETLVRRLAEARGFKAEALLAKVMEREQGISTTLDTGLSLPHARIDGLKDFVAVLGLVPQGLGEPQQPDLVIKAMLVFFSPNSPDDKAVFQKHLLFLKHVSTLFQPAFIDQLAAAPDAKAVLALIKAKEA